ncbi:hypothetical protein [Leptospira alexanderi]|uniref:hypothetical protein n=1 Tax=Leptospira alexanderi TaxID=100053 RepID=UPI00058716A2|nr:hypothetical protein [Leptospira alexanderi]
MQTLRLTPDQRPRLYVRAQWKLKNKVVFLLSAWICPDKNMLVEVIDPSKSSALRISEYQHMSLNFKDLGTILNVFDEDGDGWREVLMYNMGYESESIDLLEYSKQGPKENHYSSGHGC